MCEMASRELLLTPTQVEVVRRVATYGYLSRWPGGFWTVAGVARNARGAPDWSVDIRTVRALERKGIGLGT